MQGVDALGDFAVQIRMKMMTLPGENFVIRRKALAMIKKAFDANGIKFAFPTVQIAGDGEPSTAAVAQDGLELTRPQAAAWTAPRAAGAKPAFPRNGPLHRAGSPRSLPFGLHRPGTAGS